MRWSLPSIRNAGRLRGDFPEDGEAALGSGRGFGLVSGPESGLGFGGGGLQATGTHEGAKSGADKAVRRVRPEPGADEGQGYSESNRFNGGSNGVFRGDSDRENGLENDHENDLEAQHLDEDGVPEDMATLVLDNSALGVGPAERPGAVGGHPELDPTSDAAIMLQVAAGDEASFNFLVGKHHRAMIHFLFRMVRNQAVAEELAQEVFLRVYRARDSYRAEARFTTWLYRIATNLAVNHARDTKHERSAQTIYLDAPDEETGTTPDVADDEPSVEQKLMRDERMAAIRTHVMALPERQRMAVLMHKYQGMDYRQIGDVLKLSESATKSLLFRAYQTLRDKLKDFV
jgi:RNA polymerase sigma-70 factor (ECF subfamily)